MTSMNSFLWMELNAKLLFNVVLLLVYCLSNVCNSPTHTLFWYQSSSVLFSVLALLLCLSFLTSGHCISPLFVLISIWQKCCIRSPNINYSKYSRQSIEEKCLLFRAGPFFDVWNKMKFVFNISPLCYYLRIRKLISKTKWMISFYSSKPTYTISIRSSQSFECDVLGHLLQYANLYK